MAGEREEFTALFEREFDACVRVARRVVAEPALAEELAAEAFTRAWVRWRSVRRYASPGGWVVRVTTNLALDEVRRGAAPMPATADAAALDEAIAAHLSLLAAVHRLPARQRTAISLRYFADLSVEGIAEAMGVSAGAVKTHLHRGLERLRRLVAADDEYDLEARLVRRL